MLLLTLCYECELSKCAASNQKCQGRYLFANILRNSKAGTSHGVVTLFCRINVNSVPSEFLTETLELTLLK